MPLHPRYREAEKAKREFERFMLQLEEDYNLTTGETLSMIGNFLALRARYIIRSERHPDDPDKKGDEV